LEFLFDKIDIKFIENLVLIFLLYEIYDKTILLKNKCSEFDYQEIKFLNNI